MIKDSQQYEITKSWVAKFSEASSLVRENEERRLNDPQKWQLMQDSYNAQRQNLLDEIAEYEALLAHDSSQPIQFELSDMRYLSDLLIKARIALKITPKELAHLSNHTESEIIQFEDKNYHNATYLTFLRVQAALGFKVKDGKFIAQLNDFYRQQLDSFRRESNLDTPIVIAS